MTVARRLVVVGTAIGLLAITAARLTLSARAAQAPPTRRTAAEGATSQAVAGQSVTSMPDGRWLLVGGVGAGPNAWLFDPVTQTRSLVGALHFARAWHSATLMPDGRVLVIGGVTDDGQLISTSERFDPATETFELVNAPAIPRMRHTATLLPTGDLAIVGGRGADNRPVETVDLWNRVDAAARPIAGLNLSRTDHHAQLLPDGTILIASGTSNGGRTDEPFVVDPLRGRIMPVGRVPDENAAPTIFATIPPDGSREVPTSTRFVVVPTHPLDVQSVTPAAVTLSGPSGPVPSLLVPAEGGRVLFITPLDPLDAGTRYTLAGSGVRDTFGRLVMWRAATFVTAGSPVAEPTRNDDLWVPQPGGSWTTNLPDSTWQRLRALQAPPGATALAGQVLRLDGVPLKRVTLRINGSTTMTDGTGRFLLRLDSATTAHQVLDIDGATANTRTRAYGFFEYGLNIRSGRTTVLPFTIWMPALDTAHAVTIPSPTTAETVIANPIMPGLELHLPAGTIVRDEDGKAVQTISLTPVPLDRTPFPLPDDATFPMFFTIQPGGAYVYTPGPERGGWLVYPNANPRDRIGQRVQFFNYDPDDKGWYVYGMGTVAAAKVVPDAKTRIYAFTGASYNDGNTAPPDGPPKNSTEGGDPVAISKGIFTMRKTDLYVPDVMPLALTRMYNSADPYQRAFGTGMTHPYAMFQHSEHQFDEADVYLADGAKLHYVRTSANGLPWYSTVFEHTATPSEFYKSRETFNGSEWELALTDGTVYVFGHQAPLQRIRDRYGNEIRLTWSATNSFGAGTGNITRVTSPSGRYIDFTYYSGTGRVYQASDNLGRTVTYTYDASGNLATVTDPESHVTTYTWDTSNRLLSIEDGRNIIYLTNQYDTNGRVTLQTLADGTSTYQYAYTTDGSGNVTQADLTDPHGHVKRFAFNGDHYPTSDTEAYGTSLARTTTYTRQTGSNFVTATVDGLGRETDYTYDSAGRVLTATRLAGTSGAATTTYTYESLFGQPASVTDPLNHTWAIGYDGLGHVTCVTDPLSHQRTFGTNGSGQVTSVTDALNHEWQYGYTSADLTSITNPLSATTYRFVDAGGRLLSTLDPLGRRTQTSYDGLNRVTATTDALGAQTSFGYDANSNLVSLTDARTHTTSYTYDDFDQVATRTDPLSNAATYVHDALGALTQATDRESQVTAYAYDALDRLSQVTFDDSSTINYTYDAGDRITDIEDSANGTITRSYDDLDRLTEESTAEGTVDYTYDAAGRRTSMTVAGQTAVTYTYDDANRLTAVTQGSASVSITYDDADRRSTLTYPNGIVAAYGYDAANQLTSLTYTLGGSTLGDLTYTYDAAGQRTSVGGSWARTGLPAALTSATYDAANRIATWGGTSYAYDLNGSLTSDGTNSYTWNARNQLSGMSGGIAASFTYDGAGRRRGKTIAGSTTKFLYDGLNFVQELSSGGTPTANLLTGPTLDETFTRTDAGGTSTFLVDGLRSTLELADGSGTLQTHYTYEPFGAVTVSGATSTNAQQFTGRENDGTGLYSYRARYYHPQFQRFLSEDLLGFVGDVDFYSYVGNSPLNAIDPLGLIKLPPNPGGLGPEWTLDPTHQDPNGSRYRDPSGRPLDWHPGRPGEPGWRGKNHWHDPDNFGNRHLPPGPEVPDPAPLPDEAPGGRKDPEPSPDNPPQQQRSFCQEHPLVCVIGPLLPLLIPPVIGLPPIPVPIP